MGSEFWMAMVWLKVVGKGAGVAGTRGAGGQSKKGQGGQGRQEARDNLHLFR